MANSKYAVFDPKTHSGHWRQLTVRGGTSHIDGLMVIVEFVVNNLSEVS